MRSERRALVVLLTLFFLQAVLTFDPTALAWDGVFYYGTARSLLFDGDLDLGNDLLLSYQVVPADFAAMHFEEVRTGTGRVANPFAIGTSLLWLPWMALLRGAARLGGAGPLTGYEPLLVWGMAAVTALYGWLAGLLGCRMARRVAGGWAALLAAATAMLSTPLWYYQFREPFYAHAASALTVGVVLAAWWRFADRIDPARSLLLGLACGMAALVRWQNLGYLLLPLSTLVWFGVRGREREAARAALLVAAGAAPLLAVQGGAWYAIYGRPLLVPQGAGFMDWRSPWIGQVLFSSLNGLLPWMPLVVPATAGLVRLARRRPEQGIPLLLALGFQVYVNGCAQDWFGGGGYGPRRFANTLVILILGYACFLEGWGRRGWGIALSGLFLLHQYLLLRYGFGDRIGGYVVSMAMPYRWHAEGLAVFFRRLAGYVPRLVAHPIEALLFSPSPLSGLGYWVTW